MKIMAKMLRHLGKPSRIPASPQEATLDRVANPHPDTDYVARFTAPEFTTLCPITGQPDFAHLVIDYAPGKWLVESKSLKLYLNSFRNHGAFHEDCTVAIGKKLAELLSLGIENINPPCPAAVDVAGGVDLHAVGGARLGTAEVCKNTVCLFRQ